MSILTNQYISLPLMDHWAPPGKNTKRRFFRSSAGWGDEERQVMLPEREEIVRGSSVMGLSMEMEIGGRQREAVAEDINMDDDWDDATTMDS